MLKKTILLAAVAGFAMSTSAFAIETLSSKDQQKANQTSGQMKQEHKAGDTKAMKPSTTGSGTTSADPRDSNAAAKTPADKAKTDDAKQKQGQ
jgi:hypothetical protein